LLLLFLELLVCTLKLADSFGLFAACAFKHWSMQSPVYLGTLLSVALSRIMQDRADLNGLGRALNGLLTFAACCGTVNAVCPTKQEIKQKSNEVKQ
jgi:hypothetical protein